MAGVVAGAVPTSQAGIRPISLFAEHLFVTVKKLFRSSDNSKVISFESPARSALGGQAVASRWFAVA
jgi:hypothetical protein